MNDKQKIVIFLFALLCNFTFLATAQTPQPPVAEAMSLPECMHSHGTDSMATRRNMAFFQVHWKEKDYKNAYKCWSYVFNNAPCAYKSIYQIGPQLLSILINDKQNALRKQDLTDTLFMIFPARIRYFGEASLIKGYWAEYLSLYQPGEVKTIVNMYSDYFLEYKGIKNPDYAWDFMDNAAFALKNGLYSRQQFCELYFFLSYMAGSCLRQEENCNALMKWSTTSSHLDEVLSNHMTCSDIEALYRPQLLASPLDADLVHRVIKIYSGNKTCLGYAHFLELVEQNYTLEPNAQNAENTGDFYAQLGIPEKAREYYEKAIAISTGDDSAKLSVYQKLMDMFRQHHPNLAGTYAIKALQINPRYGRALLIQGMNIYLNRCGDTFEQAMAACAATDLFKKAKSVDPSCTKEANAYIATYHKFYPGKADVVKRKLKTGAAYTIPCSGYTTTIQTRSK